MTKKHGPTLADMGRMVQLMEDKGIEPHDMIGFLDAIYYARHGDDAGGTAWDHYQACADMASGFCEHWMEAMFGPCPTHLMIGRWSRKQKVSFKDGKKTLTGIITETEGSYITVEVGYQVHTSDLEAA